MDIHHAVDQQTPFLAFLEGYLDWFDVSKCQISSPNEALRNWLTDLQAAGTDLEQFGDIEHSVWKRELTQRAFGPGDAENQSCHRLIGFSYGPCSDD